MKTMGLADLRLVAPGKYPAPEAQWLATHAGDVLENARVHPALADAIADCSAAFALSARPREWSTRVLDARAAAARAAALEGAIAFVFGNESAGLTNDEMLACQYLVHIPANPEFTSLNLAQAVQVVAYELLMAGGAVSVPAETKEKPATIGDLEGLYAHLEQAATDSRFFDPASGSKLPTRLRRLFSRTVLEREEVNILRGLLNALQDSRSK